MAEHLANVYKERFEDEIIKAKRNPVVIYKALGSDGSGRHNAKAEALPRMTAEEISEWEEDQLVAGLENITVRGARRSGFSDYLEKEGEEAEGEVTFQQDEYPQEERFRERDEDTYYNRSQGPGEGHGKVDHGIVGKKAGFRQKVYIASLDTIATVYEDNGNIITAKTTDGEWLTDFPKSEVKIIATNRPTMERSNPGPGQPGSGDDEVFPVPRKRDRNDRGSMTQVERRDESSESMHAFSGRESYAEKRRQRS